jgi:FkbM family methyltransferase
MKSDGSAQGQRRVRFDIFEVILITTFAVVAVWMAMSARGAGQDLVLDDEGARLRSLYGPDRNSQFIEEWVIRDFFQDRRGGFFVDVGASDYRKFSNTYYLETVLGWEGIAVEPLTQFAADYAAHRPRTRFRPFFVSSDSNETAKLFVLESVTEVSSSEKSFTERWGKDAKTVEVPTITLNDLLRAERVTRIDFLSMDIELHEPEALAGFDVRQFAPQLVCIEAHPEVRQAILNYFTTNGYAVVGKYLRSDIMNLYFSPVSQQQTNR